MPSDRAHDVGSHRRSDRTTHTDRRDIARAELQCSPDLNPAPGWTTIGPAPFAGRASAFVSGPGNGNRIRVRYFRCEPEGTLAGKVWFGADAEGRPGCVHTGSLAALLDEAMALAAWLNGHSVVTSTMTTHFRQELPLGLVCTLGAWVSVVADQRVQMRALIAGPLGQTCADAEGVYLVTAPLSTDLDNTSR